MNESRRSPAVARIAFLIGDPARAEALTALLGGQALSATELARTAAVSKSTISIHLEKLLRSGLLAVERQGRHKYFRLAHGDVARALESLLCVATRTGATQTDRRPADPALRRARVCYDHLAGELGVWVHEALLRVGAYAASRNGSGSSGTELGVTALGERLFEDLGIDVGAVRARRRSFCRPCLDWTERRHHLAGGMGAALLSRILERRWARRAGNSRALLFSGAGEAALRRAFTVR
jgi:DNA-binding transcriptional ArsR family regulator